VNVAALIAETVEPVGAAYAAWFAALEHVSIAIFTVEYLARVVCAPASPRFPGALLGRVRYLLTPMALVDLAAILPAYLPALGLDLRSLRVVRMMRLVRILKIARYSRALQGLRAALASRKEELILSGFATAILLVLSSTVLYLAEHEAQPEVFGSIPAAAWWGVTTLTTVGYGDVTPITLFGKLAAAAVSIMGIGLFALPAGILGSAFVEQLRGRVTCPHCGKEV
jgi:voltage-gated potassium channel